MFAVEFPGVAVAPVSPEPGTDCEFSDTVDDISAAGFDDFGFAIRKTTIATTASSPRRYGHFGDDFCSMGVGGGAGTRLGTCIVGATTGLPSNRFCISEIVQRFAGLNCKLCSAISRKGCGIVP